MARLYPKFTSRIPFFDPMVCPQGGGTMKVIALITEYAVVGRIIDHLKLTFVAAKPPPSHVSTEVARMAPEENTDRGF